MATLGKVNFKHGTRDGKHEDLCHIISREYEVKKGNGKGSRNFSGLKTKKIYKIKIMSEKGI